MNKEGDLLQFIGVKQRKEEEGEEEDGKGS